MTIPEAALPALRQTCRVLQIIILSLAAGIGAFATYVVATAWDRLHWTAPTEPMGLIFLGMALAVTIASLAVAALFPLQPVPRAQVAAEHPAFRPTGDPQADRALAMTPAVQTRTIVSAALLEGGAFANLFGAMSAGEGWCLAAAGVLLVLLVLKFPTFGRYLDWVESGLRQQDEAAMRQEMLK